MPIARVCLNMHRFILPLNFLLLTIEKIKTILSHFSFKVSCSHNARSISINKRIFCFVIFFCFFFLFKFFSAPKKTTDFHREKGKKKHYIGKINRYKNSCFFKCFFFFSSQFSKSFTHHQVEDCSPNLNENINFGFSVAFF